ncbi:MAG: hypothetical protein AABY75_05590 [Bacteroidota bacterium]
MKPDLFVVLPVDAIDRGRELGGAGTRVLLWLYRNVQRKGRFKGTCQGSVRSIARETGLSTEAAADGLGRLLTYGLVEIAERGKNRFIETTFSVVGYRCLADYKMKEKRTEKPDATRYATRYASGDASITLGGTLQVGDTQAEKPEPEQESGISASRMHGKQAETGRNREEHDAKTSLDVLLSRYSPEGQATLQQGRMAFAKTRRTGKMADTLWLAFLKWCDTYPVEHVLSGLTVYLDRDYAGEGKAEKYAEGIIRNFKPGNGGKPTNGGQHQQLPAAPTPGKNIILPGKIICEYIGYGRLGACCKPRIGWFCGCGQRDTYRHPDDKTWQVCRYCGGTVELPAAARAEVVADEADL